jgi:hypothetical protein
MINIEIHIVSLSENTKKQEIVEQMENVQKMELTFGDD